MYGVARGSRLGPKYIAHLKQFADKNNGRVVLPMSLVDFNDSEKSSETIIKCPLQAVLSWGKPDPKKAELVIEDSQGKQWKYTGPVRNFRAEGEGRATYEGDTYEGGFKNGKFDDMWQGTIRFANGDSL